MGAYIEYATYVIFFHDRTEYEFAVIASGGTFETGGQFFGSPQEAAAFFDIPYPFPSGDMDAIDKGVYYIFPYVPPYEPYGPASPSGAILTDALPSIEVPPLNSTFGPVGQTWTLQWRGVILYMQGESPTTGTPTNIPPRRFIGGVELTGLAAEGGSLAAEIGSRDASRTIDGFGIAIRANNVVTTTWARNVTQYSGVNTRTSWERLYFRVRALPTSTACVFWKCSSSVQPNSGAGLAIGNTGALLLYGINIISAGVLNGTGPTLDLDTWYKLDILLSFPSGAGLDGQIIVYLNGSLVFNFTDSSGDGLDVVGFHGQSTIGRGCNVTSLGTTDATVQIDLDDWINADVPVILDSVDFLMGSHVRRGPINVGGTVTNWTPLAAQLFNQPNNAPNGTTNTLVTTTASALLEGTCDLPLVGEQDKLGEVSLGCVAALVAINAVNSAGNDGQLGYNAAGAGNVMTTIAESAVPTYFSTMFRPSGLQVPVEITPFLIRYTKAADATTETVRMLAAVFEYIGIWGAEDAPDGLFPADMPRTDNLHNCVYPNSVWGYMGPTPEALAVSYGVTYIGNGTSQNIDLPYPANLIFIRALTGGSQGLKWITPSIGGHLGNTDLIAPQFRVWMDSTGQVKFTVAGAHVDLNAAGVTYQVIAFCDPGMRFSVSDAYSPVSAAASLVHILQNTDFTPTFMFNFRDTLGSSGGAVGITVKGPGNTATGGSNIDGSGQITNYASFAANQLTTLANLHPNFQSQLSFMLFRSTEPDCGYVMAQILNYTGNGAGSQVITLTPTSNRFPLFVLVVPATGSGQAAIFRDPSHAGSNSARFDTLANTATGITAVGMDQITVGASLNSNGVVYNVFCLPGDEVAMVNGTFFPPNCETGPGFYLPPLVPPEVAVLGDGGLQLNGTVPLTLLKDVSGIYTMVPGKTNDTLYDRQTGQDSVDVKIPDPTAKTGFIGG